MMIFTDRIRAAPPWAPRVLTIVLTVLAVAAVVGNAILGVPPNHPLPLDYSYFGAPGAALLQGHWGMVYDDKTVQAGPFELIVWGVVHLLGVQTPAQWVVVHLVLTLLIAIAFAAVMRWQLRRIDRRWAGALTAGATVLAAGTATFAAATTSAHPAQAIVPILWMVVAMLARDGRPLAAALVLGSTTGWETWGMLGLPILLLAPRIDLPTIWRSMVGVLLPIAVLFGPFLLIGDFQMFSYVWPVRTDTLIHLLFPDTHFLPWPLRLAQAVLVLAGASLVAWLIRRAPDAVWLVPFAAVALRLLADPLLIFYYAEAPLLLLCAGMAVSLARRSWWVFLLGLVAVNLLLDLPLGLTSYALVIAATAGMVALTIRRQRRHPEPAVPSTPLPVRVE